MVLFLKALAPLPSDQSAPDVGKVVLVTPLSAQACMPGRPSGAAKEKKETEDRGRGSAHADGPRGGAGIHPDMGGGRNQSSSSAGLVMM